MKSFVIILLLVTVDAQLARGRTWTDDEGQTIEAELLGVTKDSVIFKTESAETVTVLIRRLSKTDQDHLAKLDEFSDEQAKLNQIILDFAESKKGKVIGRGNCGELVFEALKFAQIPVKWPTADYGGYGQEVPLSHLKPGDILFFKTAKFVTVKKGRNFATRRESILGHPQHIAIVRTAHGTEAVILHQGNINQPRQGVSTLKIDFTELKDGTVKAFRPNLQARESAQTR